MNESDRKRTKPQEVKEAKKDKEVKVSSCKS